MLKQGVLLGNSRPFLIGLVLGLLPTSCASLPFTYRYYAPAPTSYEGTLLGPKPSDDIPFQVCEPDAKEKAKCVVLKSAEFFKLKESYLNLQQQLLDCQKGSFK